MSQQIDKPAGVIDLGVGQPAPGQLPVSLFESLGIGWQDLAYGDEAGDLGFREALATWLSEEYGEPVEATKLMATNGCSGTLDLICTCFARPGSTVLVEDPSYFIALRLFKDHAINLVAVPMDGSGIGPDALESALLQHQPSFIYTIPTYHNPTGITQPDDRRRELVDLAKRYDCPIVADEVYQQLYFQRPPPPPLASYDYDAPVLSIGSFSKILAPGLRLGWVQGSESMLQRLQHAALLKSGGGLAPVTSALVRPLLTSGRLQRHLLQLRQIYRARQDRLYDGLQAVLGDYLQVNKPEGGYFLWATATDGKDLSATLSAAEDCKVRFLGGSAFSVNQQFADSMRLCFAWYEESELALACERLERLLAG